MNILLMEDHLNELQGYQEYLKDNGYKVYPCMSVYKGKEEWGKKSGDIDCVIVDLAMPPEGLKNLQDTEDGSYTGWIFIRDEILPSKPDFIRNCLILTNYGKEFLRDFYTKNKLKDIGFKKEQIIFKKDSGHKKKLLEALEKIQKNTKRSI